MADGKPNLRSLCLILGLGATVFLLGEELALADHEFVVRQFDGSITTGRIRSIDDQGSVQGQNLPAGLQMANIVSLDSGQPVKRLPDFDVTIALLDGGTLFVEDPLIVDDKVSFAAGCGLSEIPLQSLRAIVWSDSPAVKRLIASPSPDRDSVLVETSQGERGVEGIIERLDHEQLQINYQGDSRKIGIAKINAIVMADLGLEPLGDSLATVNMTDGSTLVGEISNLRDNDLTIDLTGGSVALDVSAIANISVPSDRVLFLSELEPLEVQQKTDFTVLRPWQKNLSVEKNPLAIRYGNSEKIAEFKNGLGTQAFCLLVFQNSHGFDRFNAVVGIDAETHGRGDCQMVVLGDDIELWSRRVRGVDDPLDVDINIEGINQVSLVVYPGENFDLADHADWCNARFVKTK